MAKVIIKKNHSTIPRMASSFLKRFHLLIFFVLVISFLVGTILLINKALSDSSSQQYTSTIEAGTIDQATLERIQSLHTSDQPTTIELPEGRVNPFAE